MDEFLKMDVFFVVTTVAVVLVGALLGLVLWRLHRILKNVEHVSEQVAIETDFIRQDISDIRAEIRSGRSRFASLTSFFTKMGKRASKKSNTTD